MWPARPIAMPAASAPAAPAPPAEGPARAPRRRTRQPRRAALSRPRGRWLQSPPHAPRTTHHAPRSTPCIRPAAATASSTAAASRVLPNPPGAVQRQSTQGRAGQGCGDICQQRLATHQHTQRVAGAFGFRIRRQHPPVAAAAHGDDGLRPQQPAQRGHLDFEAVLFDDTAGPGAADQRVAFHGGPALVEQRQQHVQVAAAQREPVACARRQA